VAAVPAANPWVTKYAVIRSRLIGKGVIYAPEYGTVQFTVPGMAGFIARQTEG
jgi:hypothetical protein